MKKLLVMFMMLVGAVSAHDHGHQGGHGYGGHGYGGRGRSPVIVVPVVIGPGHHHYHGLRVVTVVGASWCGFCHAQMDELNRLGIPSQYIDGTNGYPGVNAFPTMTNGYGQTHVGFLSGQMLIDFARGY